jgi:threonyl-tRNA synthetase
MIDHRQLGRELDLFDSDPLIGAGLPFWLPAGAAARHAVEEHLREAERRAGYRHVYSPPLGRRELYERSGHWAHFAEDMFPPIHDGGAELVLRPSLCPHHALIYRSRGRSYRDLPVRLAEIGGMYRAERSGVLGGLHRVRAISLNDAHIFCAPEQLGAEVRGVLDLMRRVHSALGVQVAGIRLALRGSGGGYAGDAGDWERAEAVLRDALDGLSYVEAPGEAAFYGPKVDVQIVDPAGRESTLATVQVDFHQPGRFELSYVDAGGQRRRPVMVHRSVAGSMERLFGAARGAAGPAGRCRGRRGGGRVRRGGAGRGAAGRGLRRGLARGPGAGRPAGTVRRRDRRPRGGGGFGVAAPPRSRPGRAPRRGGARPDRCGGPPDLTVNLDGFLLPQQQEPIKIA